MSAHETLIDGTGGCRKFITVLTFFFFFLKDSLRAIDIDLLSNANGDMAIIQTHLFHAAFRICHLYIT